MSRSVPNIARLLEALELGGCRPQRLRDGCIVAACPVCRLNGREALIAIDPATSTVACLEAHEPPRSREVAA